MTEENNADKTEESKASGTRKKATTRKKVNKANAVNKADAMVVPKDIQEKYQNCIKKMDEIVKGKFNAKTLRNVVNVELSEVFSEMSDFYTLKYINELPPLIDVVGKKDLGKLNEYSELIKEAQRIVRSTLPNGGA